MGYKRHPIFSFMVLEKLQCKNEMKTTLTSFRYQNAERVKKLAGVKVKHKMELTYICSRCKNAEKSNKKNGEK